MISSLCLTAYALILLRILISSSTRPPQRLSLYHVRQLTRHSDRRQIDLGSRE